MRTEAEWQEWTQALAERFVAYLRKRLAVARAAGIENVPEDPTVAQWIETINTARSTGNHEYMASMEKRAAVPDWDAEERELMHPGVIVGVHEGTILATEKKP